MYDWIRTAPSVNYDTKNYVGYKSSDKLNAFGMRSIPPKANGLKNSVSIDKNLNVLGRTVSNSSRVKPAVANGLKSRSNSNKSMQRLLGASQEDIYPKLQPVPKQRANLIDSSKDTTSHNYFTNGPKQSKSEDLNNEIAKKISDNKGLSDYENNNDEDYDNFTYMDQYFIPTDDTDLYDNVHNKKGIQKATTYFNDKEINVIIQERDETGMKLVEF